MHTHGWLSLMPPLLAVGLALWFRRVIPALLAGIVCAVAIRHGDRLASVPVLVLDRIMATAAVPDNLRLIAFSLLIGGLIALLTEARAFEAFATLIENRRGGLRKRGIHAMTLLLGTALFLETWSNVLVNGTSLRSLYDRLGISRERMAYFMHTVAISVVALVPVNSWAAFYMGLLRAQGVANPFRFLLASIPYMLFCWLSLVLVLLVMARGWTFGPLRRFETGASANGVPRRRDDTATEDGPAGRPAAIDRARTRTCLLLLTLATLIATVLLGLMATGDGDPRAGNGAAAVLYAVVAAIAVAALALRLTGMLGLAQIEEKIIAGCGSFAGVGVLIVLALTLGALVKDIGTGAYIAQSLQASVARPLLAPLIFLVAALMSFATGTSYGTFAIMTPIAIPLALATGANPHLMFGACIAGGVFGDNTSPLSDTSIVTSVATQVRLIDHVATQLPYALVAATASTAGFLVLGLMLD